MYLFLNITKQGAAYTKDTFKYGNGYHLMVKFHAISNSFVKYCIFINIGKDIRVNILTGITKYSPQKYYKILEDL